MATVKLGLSRQVVIPKTIYDQLGLETGDFLEVGLDGHRIIMTPKALVDKCLIQTPPKTS